MPELFRDEETETRTHSLCLYNVSGASWDNRCERCPARAGNWIQQRRCPLGELEHHSPVGAAGEGKSESSDPKFLATSSKSQHVPEVVAISDKIADVSLDEPNRRYVRHSRSDAGIRNPSTDMSASVPHVDIGVKRKAYREPESSLRTELAGVVPLKASADTEVGDLMPKFKDGSKDVEKRLRNKPQHIFQDLPSDEPPFIEGTWDVYAAVPATLRSLLNGYQGCSNSVQEDHPSGRASSLGIRIPGTRMRTEGEGISSCNDGISNRHDPKEFDLLMAQEISELSIDQIEESRIDGSYFV